MKRFLRALLKTLGYILIACSSVVIPYIVTVEYGPLGMCTLAGIAFFGVIFIVVYLNEKD